MIRIERKPTEDGNLVFVVGDTESPMSTTLTIAKNLLGIFDSKQMLKYFVRELNYLFHLMDRAKR